MILLFFTDDPWTTYDTDHPPSPSSTCLSARGNQHPYHPPHPYLPSSSSSSSSPPPPSQPAKPPPTFPTFSHAMKPDYISESDHNQGRATTATARAGSGSVRLTVHSTPSLLPSLASTLRTVCARGRRLPYPPRGAASHGPPRRGSSSSRTAVWCLVCLAAWFVWR